MPCLHQGNSTTRAPKIWASLFTALFARLGLGSLPARNGRYQIAATDNARQLAITDHGSLVDLLCQKQRRNVFNRLLFVNGDRRRRHDVFGEITLDFVDTSDELVLRVE